MTDEEIAMLKNYKNTIIWLGKGTLIEFEGIWMDSRLIDNPEAKEKVFKISREVNDFYFEKEENILEVEKIYQELG